MRETMKKYKVTASYVTTCQVVIEAENEEQAFWMAKNLDGGDFDSRLDNDDWHIESVMEVKE
jgi:hypothetical protein